MAYQPKSSRKFITGVASAALVASAVAPVAASAAAQSPIVKVYQANNITAYKGQSTKDLKINPTVKGKVKVKYKNGKTAWVAVKWENVSFTKAGSKTVYGTVAGTKIKAKVKVTVKVDSVAYVNNQQNVKVDQGITKEELLAKLPAKVKVKLASGKTQLNEATYDLSKVDFDKAGDYKVTVHAAHAPAKLDREITVTLNSVDPAVTSVSAINAKKILVTFNKAVDKTSATDALNYTLVGAGGVSSIDLQPDEKSVVITLNTPVENDTTFVVTVAEIATKADTSVKTAKYTKSITFSDTVRPTLKNVVYPKPGVAELNFSEELSTVGTVTVYDGLVESTSVTKDFRDDKLTLGGLELNKEYKVVITGAKDQSGNMISAPIEVTVKNGVTDTVKPVASSISSQGLDTVKVQFSEPLKNLAANPATDPAKYVDIDVNGVAATGTITQSFDAETNVLTIKGITGITNGSVKSITVKNFKDLAGLSGDSVTKVLAFSTAAPSLKSTQVVKEGTKTYAVLTFDKAVPTISGTVNASYITADNVYKTTTLAATVDTSKNQVKLEVTNKEAGTYTVTFAAGSISDGATSNDKPFDVKFNVGTSVDTSVPEVANVFLPGDLLPDGKTTVAAGNVYVSYSKPMGTSALNAANYTVDGVSVFTNPIFVGDKTLVKLTLKDSAITISGDRNFGISNLVKGENNVAIKTYTNVKYFNENVRPNLTSAALVDGNTIELTFSELLGTVGFDTADNDFVVTVGGVKNVVTAVTDGIVGDNKVTITLTDSITADQLRNSVISVKTLDTTDITDKAGNLLVANTVVNVAK